MSETLKNGVPTVPPCSESGNPTPERALPTSPSLHCSQGKLNYKRSRTIISVYPSRFCPFHFVLSNLLGSFIDNPIPQIRSFTAHSANIASPVDLILSFKIGRASCRERV